MSENDSLLEIYIYENSQLLEQLEGILLAADKLDRFSAEQVGSIFRILHTVKGSSAMMNYDSMAALSHSIEDLFGYIRDNMEKPYDHRRVCDMVFPAMDFLRKEIEVLQAGGKAVEDSSALAADIHEYYNLLKGGGESTPASPTSAVPAQEHEPGSETSAPAILNKPAGLNRFYHVQIRFEKDCKMENVRAFGVVKSIEGMAGRLTTVPEDLLQDASEAIIAEKGFTIYFESREEIALVKKALESNSFVEKMEIDEIPPVEVGNTPLDNRKRDAAPAADSPAAQQTQRNNFMSVRLDKMDKLMDLMGEIVITEAAVIKSPDILNITTPLEMFLKSARHLQKLTDELQDIVMSMRMIPISGTFHKLERIVRDMAKKTGKQADLIISGEETEMDKNVIDTLSDPLMHIIRNSMDHGIEMPEVRQAMGKNPTGKITLEAKNTGGDVLITVTDDGHGLNRDELIQKGIERGLIKKAPEDLTDREVYNLIFTAGFSTKQAVTEFSGRGVGMDVAMRNITKIGGSINVDSEYGNGMSVQLRIPLTLAIIDGMQVSVGGTIFILPLLSIRQSFRPGEKDVFTDPEGNEMIMIFNDCYRVLRLYKILKAETEITRLEDGILILIESDLENYCLFVDSLIGELQTVIKPIPSFISRNPAWLKGISASTIMGDGTISLILDPNTLVS